MEPAMNEIVLLNLRISMWGVNRVLPENEYEVDADRAMVRPEAVSPYRQADSNALFRLAK